MKKSEFTIKYKISDAVPTRLETNKISIRDFSKTLKKFLEDNFSGLATVEIEIHDKFDCNISVCADYVAYFCKLLLSYCHNKAFLKLTTRCTKEEYSIHIESDCSWPLTMLENADLVKSAKNAKFNAVLTDNGLLITSPVQTVTRYAVFAISSNILEDKLHEIFFCGYSEE